MPGPTAADLKAALKAGIAAAMDPLPADPHDAATGAMAEAHHQHVADYVAANAGAANTVLYGAGAPANGLGDDGNFYIDTVAHDLYGPKAGGSWPAGTSLVGPQGPAGADGADGADGAQGPQGPAGSSGSWPNLLTDVSDFSALAGWEFHPPDNASGMTAAQCFTLAAGGLTMRCDRNFSQLINEDGYPIGISRPHDSNNFTAKVKLDSLANQTTQMVGGTFWRCFIGQRWGPGIQWGIFNGIIIEYDNAGAGGVYWRCFKVDRLPNVQTWRKSTGTTFQVAKGPAPSSIYLKYEWAVLSGYKVWSSPDDVTYTEIGAGTPGAGYVDNRRATTTSTYNAPIGLGPKRFCVYHGIDTNIAGGAANAATVRVASISFTGVS